MLGSLTVDSPTLNESDLHFHAVYGLTIASDMVLSSVARGTGRKHDPDIRISFGSPDLFDKARLRAAPDPHDWVQHVVLPDGRVFMRAEKVFETLISVGGRKVVCRKLGDVDQRSFEANLLNFVLAACLTLQGEEPLHATVVELADRRSIGLLGMSGAGKSTLAAYLIGEGADLITDDMLRMRFSDGAVLAYPGPYRLKLFEKDGRRFLPAATAKGQFNPLRGKVMVEPLPMTRPRNTPVRLSALFHLGDPGDDLVPGGAAPTATRLAGLQLAKILISSAMDNRYAETHRLKRQIEFAKRVAGALPVYALRYPRRFDVMKNVAAEIGRVLLSP
jgi:hypothetical protein